MFLQYKTDRLIIEPFTTSDSAFIFELLNTDGWIKNIGNRNIKDKNDSIQYIHNQLCKSYNNNDYGFYKVSLFEKNVPIGMCGLNKRDYLPYHDLGFAFLPQYHKKGFAFESAAMILEKESKRLSFTKIGAICLPDNETSISLLGKLSFQFITTLKKDDEFLNYYEATLE